MKKLSLAFFLLLASGPAFGISYDSGGGIGATGILPNFRVNGLGDDVVQATTTMTDVAGESRAFLFDATYAGTDPTGLPSTIWSFMHYNQSGVVTTAHGGAVFGRAIAGTAVQGFHFGVEGNDWNNSTLSTANGVGVIGHAVWEGAATSSPTAATIGVESRAEITDPTITTARSGAIAADIIAFRAETYGGSTSTWDSRNYNFYGAVGGSKAGKIINNGPIMAIAVTAQVIANGDTILSDGCGTIKQVSSGGAVTTSVSNTFSAPSISTSGPANIGCWMIVTNVGANIITLDNNANFLTESGIDIALPSAASVMVASNGTTWVQISPITITTLGGVYLSSATLAANTAATTVFGNHGTISLTPGDWDVSGACEVSLNGSVTTALAVALSANTGNTTTDHVVGDNQLQSLPPTAAADVSVSIPGWRQAVAASTSIFIKVKATFSAGSPQAACRISARRVQ